MKDKIVCLFVSEWVIEKWYGKKIAMRSVVVRQLYKQRAEDEKARKHIEATKAQCLRTNVCHPKN